MNRRSRIALSIAAIVVIAAFVIKPHIYLKAQGFNSGRNSPVFTTTGSDVSIFQHGAIGFHSIIWTTTGAPASCTIAVDSSFDGVSWTAGGVIANTTCTSSGSTQVNTTAVYANYVRITVVALSGGATVQVNYSGWGLLTTGVQWGTANGITVGGANVVYTGADFCAALKTATGTTSTGILNATGFTGAITCTPANTLNMINPSFAGVIQLGCPLILALPLQSSGAATSSDPLQGTLIVPTKTSISGCNYAGASGAVNTTVIKACQAANNPVVGCTAPATHEFAVTAVTLTNAGNRTYMTATVAGADIVGGEPLRFQNYQNIANNSFEVRACQQVQTAPARVDPTCPISVPTATSIAFPVNSGVWSLASIGGTNTGYSGSITWNTGTTGGCLYPASGVATQSAGVINAVLIQNRGRGCTSQPTATPYGTGGGSNATLTFNIATACASACGTLHASIPLMETGPFPTNNAFHIRIEHLTLDCTTRPDCVNFRTLTMNEGSTVHNVLATNPVERCFDAHTFTVQNSDTWEGNQCTAGQSPANDSGTVSFFSAEYGPHGVRDFTSNFSNATNPQNACFVLDGDTTFMYLLGGHCENALYNVLLGADSPARGYIVQNWAGAPQGVTQTTGPYQNEVQSVIKVRSEYFTNNGAVAAVITGDYSFGNIIRNAATTGAGTIVDDNPVNNPTLSAALFNTNNGYSITDILTERYEVDQSSAGNINVNTTALQGSFYGTNFQASCNTNTNFYLGNQIGSASTVVALTQNKAALWRIYVPCGVSAGHIGVVIGVADATGTNLYDVGLYGPNCSGANLCNLLVDSGAQTGTTLGFTATGAKNIAFQQGNTYIPAGSYLLAFTTNSTTPASLLGGQSQIGVLNGNVTLTTASGALTTPNVIAPSNSLGTSTIPEYLLQP